MVSSQEDLLRSTNCSGAVASNEDNAIELMMYRQSGARSDVAPAEPLPDEPGPAERGEAPPLREVTMRVFRINDHQQRLFLEVEKLTFINRVSPLNCRFLSSLVRITDSATSR